jgi:hypothetical protein
MLARDLARSVGHDPERTAREWLARSPSVPDQVDWAELLLLALRHRLCGLLVDSLAAAGWLDAIPPTIHEQLHHWAGMARVRQLELEAALRELADRHPAEVGRVVLLKGAAIYGDYRERTHRLMADFDTLFSAEDFARVEPSFAELGYWRKESLNGPTYYRASDGPEGRMSLDVHVLGPSKYYRPEEALSPKWLTETEPYEVGGVALSRPRPVWQLVNVVTHAHEHLHSWIHAVAEDDIRSIRFLDAELLLERHDVDPAQAWALAEELGLQGEYALGLWCWHQVRGLPERLAGALPLVERLDEVGELTALPRGRFARWPVPLAERAWLTDRLALALSLEPEHSGPNWGGLQEWYRTQGMVAEQRENVEGIAEKAREIVAAAPAEVAAAR